MLPNLAVAAAFTLGTAGVFAVDSALYRSAGLYECPELCSVAGPNPSNWTRFTHNRDLLWCKDQTMLISLPLRLPIGDNPDAHHPFQACVSTRGDQVKSRVSQAGGGDAISEPSEVTLLESTAKSDSSSASLDIATAIRELQAIYLDIPADSSNQTVFFAKHADSVVGVYVGANVQKSGMAGSIMEKLAEHVTGRSASGEPLPQTTLFQLCGGAGRSADFTAGVAAVARSQGLDSASAVQGFVRSWADGECVTDVASSSSTSQMVINVAYTSTEGLNEHGGNGTISNGTTIARARRSSRRSTKASIVHPMAKRGDCRVTQVASGDGCGTLAAKCGISGSDFTKYNSGSNFCSSLKPGQWVCCSSGTLPDMRPKPNPDGSCATYQVVADDYCDKIAAANGLTAKELEDLNQETWGFAGCKSLWPDMKICLSKGDPPMPVEIANAACGPQVPGTVRPTNGTKLADLNQCPLKACCNVWGFCGTTEDFCTESSLGPPGTAKPGTNGCISNCGMEIVNNDQGPASNIVLGYFEAWNFKRECLHMDVTQMSKRITHVHFAFADVTPTFSVSTAQVQEQFDKFKQISGHHKVLAFGGWAASTEPTSYWIFREGVKPANRERLASNIVNFVNENNMDGVDLDWEYPGAKDLPDIPSADPIDGELYLALLKSIRRKLPASKTLSIAAPASYWYLKAFPIAEISKVVDYIVYMTYDLHGQWDYASKWSMPGCDSASCLRSHVNITETLNALVMITKAGVPSNKVVVGVSSYGRSFQMTEAGCTGPMCGFTGPSSTAAKGRCTDTHGYISNAEIDELIRASATGEKRADSIQFFHDEDSASQILVYDNTQWVAYMDEGEKERRKGMWSGLNFAGTTDWAVDLATFTPGDDNKDCWRSKHCQSPGATDTSLESKWRWDQLCTDGAWKAAIDTYKGTNADSREDFPRAISNFFHGKPNMDCDVLAGENGCHDPVGCIQGNDTGPASTFILNSFITISNFLLNTYEGVESSQQTLEANGVLDSFVKKFAPEPKGDLALKIILDIVSFGLQAATGPFFNNFMRNTKWWKDGSNKDQGDNLKDTSRAAITFAFTTAKDAEKPKPASGAAMSEQLSVIVRHYKTSLTETSKKTFDGSDASIDYLWGLMAKGKLMDAKPSGKLELEDKMTQMFYAMLIPILWRQKEWKPVLMDLEVGCDDKDPDSKILDGDLQGKVCIDGRRYHLVRPDGRATKCPTEHAQNYGRTCTWSKVKALDGFDDLKGGGWADLRKEQIAASIVNRRKAGWGNPTEPAKFPDFTDAGTFDSLWKFIDDDNMIEAPGVIDIPICSHKEIRDNWMNKANDYYAWPCNKP